MALSTASRTRRRSNSFSATMPSASLLEPGDAARAPSTGLVAKAPTRKQSILTRVLTNGSGLLTGIFSGSGQGAVDDKGARAEREAKEQMQMATSSKLTKILGTASALPVCLS